MEKKECEECVSEFEKKGNDLFIRVETKHDLFLTKMESRHNQLTVVNLSILGMFGLAIAYIFTIQLTKAAKAETLSIKQMERMEQVMTNFYDQRFVHTDGSKIDESTYKLHIQTILESNTRGTTK